MKVDKLRMSTPAGSSTVTGPGMQVVENSDGSKSWCNSGPGGWGGFCISYRPVIDALPDSTAVFSILNGNLVWAEGQVDADGSYRPNVMTRQP